MSPHRNRDTHCTAREPDSRGRAPEAHVVCEAVPEEPGWAGCDGRGGWESGECLQGARCPARGQRRRARAVLAGERASAPAPAQLCRGRGVEAQHAGVGSSERQARQSRARGEAQSAGQRARVGSLGAGLRAGKSRQVQGHRQHPGPPRPHRAPVGWGAQAPTLSRSPDLPRGLRRASLSLSGRVG